MPRPARIPTPSEPLRKRNRAWLRVVMIAAAQWLASFAAAGGFPAVAESSLPFSRGVPATFAAVSLPFVWPWVREIRGVERKTCRIERHGAAGGRKFG